MTEKKKIGFEALAKASMQTQEQLLEVRKRRHTFFIGLPREISLQENRISLTPDAVALLVNNGHDVWVETKAGIGSKFSDKAYSDAGAKIVYSPLEVYQADVILKIEPPTLEEIELMHAGQTLISALQIGHLKVESLQAMFKKKITALAYGLGRDIRYQIRCRFRTLKQLLHVAFGAACGFFHQNPFDRPIAQIE